MNKREMMNEPLELRINRSQRLVLASHHNGVILEIQAVTTLKDGHGWHVLAQAFLDAPQIVAIQDYVAVLATHVNFCKRPLTASKTHEKQGVRRRRKRATKSLLVYNIKDYYQT